MDRSRLSSLLAGAAFLAAPAALAHAYLDRTVPGAGSTVQGPPAEVKLWFSHALEAAYSSVRVVDKDGKQVDRKDTRLDAAAGRWPSWCARPWS